MALIKSISGIRGTIGGPPGAGLTPLDIVKYTTAYAAWINEQQKGRQVIVGRDGRISGPMVESLVVSTLQMAGIEVLNLGLTTTPTLEMAVLFEKAAGGIVLTASHNPREWNALKLLNHRGEFLSAAEGKWILDYAQNREHSFASVNELGGVKPGIGYMEKHVEAILALPLVQKEAIRQRGFRVVVDPINSTGALAVPLLLQALGVDSVELVHGELTGDFAHNPEPLPQHLEDLCRRVKNSGADLGIAVDPDVDRLCFVCEDGTLFGEEYTLVAVADYVLSHNKGNTVSNLSSTQALAWVTRNHGGEYFPSAVGEVNVVEKMKAHQAVIGGEGNGGVIVPDLHYGRDALAGIALFLSQLAAWELSCRTLRDRYPDFFMSKNKMALPSGLDTETLFGSLEQEFPENRIHREDGIRIDFDSDWVHLRTSNTEPILRIYSESSTQEKADSLAEMLMEKLRGLLPAQD